MTPLHGREALNTFLDTIGFTGEIRVKASWDLPLELKPDGWETFQKGGETHAKNYVYQGTVDKSGLSLILTQYGGKTEQGDTIWERTRTHYPNGFSHLWELGHAGATVYFYPNRPHGGISNNHVTSTDLVFYEIDDRGLEEQWQALHQLKALGLEPAAVVFTGGKSLHVYFRLAEAIAPEHWLRLSRKLAIFQDSDPNICNLARAMRLPGLVRRKAIEGQLTPPTPITLEQWSERVYSPQEFEAALDSTGKFPQELSDERWRQWRSLSRRHKEGEAVDPNSILSEPESELYPQPRSQSSDFQYNGERIPLEICLSRDDRALIEQGVGQGNRDSSGYKVARNLIGTANVLTQMGIAYEPDPRQLFDEFCRQCSPPLSARDAERIWRSAHRGNPTPSLPDEALKNCISAWQYQNSGEKQRTGHSFSSFIPGWLSKLKRQLENARSSPWKGFGKKEQVNLEPTPAKSLPAIEYQLGERLDAWSQASESNQFILDSSGTGEGKSYDTGRLDPSALDCQRLVYITADPRNPTTSTLGSWDYLDGRHNGLTRDQHGKLRRVKKNQPYTVPPNCGRTATISALKEAGIPSADSAGLICQTCGHYEACKAGAVFGYLNSRATALEKTRVISHPSSLPMATDFDYGETGLIWDEWSNILTYTRQITVNQSDLDKLIAHLVTQAPEIFAQLQPLLTRLRQLLTGEVKQPNRFGWSHQQLVQQLPAVPDDLDLMKITSVTHPDLKLLNPTGEHGVDTADLPAGVRKRFSEPDEATALKIKQELVKQFLILLLQLLQGERGYLTLSYGELTLTTPDSRLVEIAKAAKANIFLDATGHLEELARLLGVSTSEIIHVRQTPTVGAELETIQVAGMGRLGQHRGNDQQRRADAVIAQLKQDDPDAGVMRFKRYASGDDYRWHIESRGVNDAEECDTLILDGIPCPNLEALAAQFTCLYGRVPLEGVEDVRYPVQLTNPLPDGVEAGVEVTVSSDPQFREFVRRHTLASLHQGIGRLRANRRAGEKLKVYILGDFPLDIPVKLVEAKEITPEAASKTERLEMAIRGAVEQLKRTGQKITQQAIAAITGCSQQHISRFKNLLISLIDPCKSKMSKTEPLPEEAEWLATEYIPLVAESPPLEMLETIGGVFEAFGHDVFRQIWESLSAVTQTRILTQLMFTLNVGELRQLLTAARAG